MELHFCELLLQSLAGMPFKSSDQMKCGSVIDDGDELMLHSIAVKDENTSTLTS